MSSSQRVKANGLPRETPLRGRGGESRRQEEDKQSDDHDIGGCDGNEAPGLDIVQLWNHKGKKFHGRLALLLDILLLIVSVLSNSVMLGGDATRSNSPYLQLSGFAVAAFGLIAILVVRVLLKPSRKSTAEFGWLYRRLIEPRYVPIGFDYFFRQVIRLTLKLGAVVLTCAFCYGYLLGWILLLYHGWAWSEHSAQESLTVFQFTLAPWKILLSTLSKGGLGNWVGPSRSALYLHWMYLTLLLSSRICLFQIAAAAIPRRLIGLAGESRRNRSHRSMYERRYLYWYLFMKAVLRRNYGAFLIAGCITYFLPLLVLIKPEEFTPVGTAVTFISFWTTGLLLLFGTILLDYIQLEKVFEENASHTLYSHQISQLSRHVILSPWSVGIRRLAVDLLREHLASTCPSDPEHLNILVDRFGEIYIHAKRFVVVSEGIGKFSTQFAHQAGIGLLSSSLIYRDLFPQVGSEIGALPIYLLAQEGDVSKRNVLSRVNFEDAVCLISLTVRPDYAVELFNAVCDLSRDMPSMRSGEDVCTPTIIAVFSRTEYDFLLARTLRNSVFLVHPSLTYGMSLARQLYPQLLGDSVLRNDEGRTLKERCDSLHAHRVVLLGHGRVAYYCLEALWAILLPKFMYDRKLLSAWVREKIMIISDDPVVKTEVLPRAKRGGGKWGLVLSRCERASVDKEVCKAIEAIQVDIPAVEESPHNIETLYAALREILTPTGAANPNQQQVAQPQYLHLVVCTDKESYNRQITTEICRALSLFGKPVPGQEEAANGGFRVICTFTVVTPDRRERETIAHTIKRLSTKAWGLEFRISPFATPGELLAQQVFDTATVIVSANSGYWLSQAQRAARWNSQRG